MQNHSKGWIVEDGRFTSLGLEQPGETKVFPGFIDSHCHVIPAGLDMLKLQLDDCTSADAVLEAVSAAVKDCPPNGWLLAAHYDQTKFPDGIHLDRWRLDAVSDGRPVLLRHTSGHASVANSLALQLAGVGESDPDPVGGSFVRDSGGRLTGVLTEKAHESVSAAAPRPTFDQMVDSVIAVSRSMASFGVTTATDMATGRWGLEEEVRAYQSAWEKGASVRLRMFVNWSAVFGPRGIGPERLNELADSLDKPGCKICGIKIFSDGAIGAGTAAMYEDYVGCEGNGMLVYEPERLKFMVKAAHDSGWPVAVHAIGDRATDLVLDAFEETGEPKRHRLEHAMVLSDGQIDRLAKLDPFVTMQPEFLVRFGHAYLRQLGPERASHLKRARSVKDAGLRLSFSSDRPIVLGDPMVAVKCASTRPTGFDPAENVSQDEAMLAYTVRGAEANFDDGYGSLYVGGPADAVWIEGDKVVRTMMGGRVTFERQSNA